MSYKYKIDRWAYVVENNLIVIDAPPLWEIDGETEIKDMGFFNPVEEYEGFLPDALSGHECGLILCSKDGRLFRAMNIDFE